MCACIYVCVCVCVCVWVCVCVCVSVCVSLRSEHNFQEWVCHSTLLRCLSLFLLLRCVLHAIWPENFLSHLLPQFPRGMLWLGMCYHMCLFIWVQGSNSDCHACLALPILSSELCPQPSNFLHSIFLLSLSLQLHPILFQRSCFHLFIPIYISV